MNVALVYDRVNKWGGAERVLLALHRMFPDAPLYTSLYHPNKARWAHGFKVKTSFLQRVSFLRDKHELLSLMMPVAFESMDFSEYDVVISVTSESAKGIITSPHTKHICICLTPPRYLWHDYNTYFKSAVMRFLSVPAVSYLRMWDKLSARRPDMVLSISKVVQKRVKDVYGISSNVLYPPSTGLLGEEAVQLPPESDYFLVVSRLVPYKRIDLAVRAATELDLPLIVIGKGVERGYLRGIAGKSVKFKEYVSEELLRGYYKNARALIYPSEEDFGIGMVEANLHGIPVVAYGRGASTEIIIEGKTGEFFTSPTVESLKDKLKNFKRDSYNEDVCKRNAERFTDSIFEKRLMEYIKMV